MATVNKDFRVKHGLVVEGTTGTIDGYDILTKSQASQDYIVGIAGGVAYITSVGNNLTVTAGELNVTGLVTSSDLSTALADYVTSSSLSSTLSGYVTSSSLSTTLGDYVTSSSLSSTLSSYVTSTSLSTTLSGYVSSSDLSTALADYVTSSSLSSTLSGYVTSTSLSTTLGDYVTTTDFGSHTSATSAHGVSGDIVGTTDSQTLSNKQLSGSTQINPISGAQPQTGYATIEYVDTDAGTEGLKIKSERGWVGSQFGGQLDVDGYRDVNIISRNGSIIVNPYGNAYVGTASSSNIISTHGWVDSLIGDNSVDGSTGNTVKDRIDTAVSNLVDGAPALLDTLNELAAAINDDASFSSTIATTIGEKVAKSGDTMTGALTLSGAPTNDLHAATKKYVDDQTTTDVAEGTNLYFTDSRAVSAIQAVVPQFTAVELNSVAKQVAATTSVSTAGKATAYSWAKASYRSAEFLVKVANGTHTEVSKVIITLDTSDNIAITEYAVVGTNGSLSTVSAEISGTDVLLTATTVNNSSTVTVVGTLLA